MYPPFINEITSACAVSLDTAFWHDKTTTFTSTWTGCGEHSVPRPHESSHHAWMQQQSHCTHPHPGSRRHRSSLFTGHGDTDCGRCDAVAATALTACQRKIVECHVHRCLRGVQHRHEGGVRVNVRLVGHAPRERLYMLCGHEHQGGC